jgi:catechol 2,3-dioxygenase-like lactoylglutathione lyase family enzyme
MGNRWDVTMDCANAPRQAAFWKLALGYRDAPPPSGFDSTEAWLASVGVPEEEWGDGAWLVDPDGAAPRLCLLTVPEGKTAKNRLHLDVRVGPDWAAVLAFAERLTAAGASVLRQDDLNGAPHHLVCADPEGNEFCLST